MAALAYFAVFLALAALTTKLFTVIYGAFTMSVGACGIFFIMVIFGRISHTFLLYINNANILSIIRKQN
jgi:hypothetical protein